IANIETASVLHPAAIVNNDQPEATLLLAKRDITNRCREGVLPLRKEGARAFITDDEPAVAVGELVAVPDGTRVSDDAQAARFHSELDHAIGPDQATYGDIERPRTLVTDGQGRFVEHRTVVDVYDAFTSAFVADDHFSAGGNRAFNAKASNREVAAVVSRNAILCPDNKVSADTDVAVVVNRAVMVFPDNKVSADGDGVIVDKRTGKVCTDNNAVSDIQSSIVGEVARAI